MSDHKPYTYVTVSLAPDKAPRVSVAFHTPDVDVHAWVLNGRRPCLDLNTREANVSISTTGGGDGVTEQDLALAREIFSAAARYLADCERLHSQTSAENAASDAA
ncbi:hypothetical protein HNP84_008609 [Thermocatellispora tengchongensis]|uniref:Uncharacterized protein n=1 Tax=Thermocatellispora tengchongensis TaxID=1073253 RepID=A0A840PM36_9ACTN|nr:hypothetical protein [Thermocatellispora tengchongensis]MBB5138851.1 hypothetical protein [Thermocatellispora tengchongensis]